MSHLVLISIIIFAIALLLFLVLRLKIHAFVSLLIVSILVGLLTGMDTEEVMESLQTGMGNTLGFVAIIVGLGAIFGQILEASGGAESVAKGLISRFGVKKAPTALAIAGFIIAIPVFLDVGFVILVPVVYSLAKDARKSVLYYGIPLAAGLAVTHAFIPPTPGPVAVANLLGANLGYVILFGLIVGIPTVAIAGPWFGRYIGSRIYAPVPEYLDIKEEVGNDNKKPLPSFSLVAMVIALPLILIVFAMTVQTLIQQDVINHSVFTNIIQFIGHPFTALIIVTLYSIYFLGTKRGFSKQQLMKLSTKALGPAGLIILITGAGGVFKQVLVDSGIGESLASAMANANFPPLVLAYLIALIVRVTQGSATVAMITAAGFMAPSLSYFEVSEAGKALMVLSIAAGATALSHVNDSGFWLIGKYFGLNEKQTLQSWTVMETIISVVGFLICLLLSFFV
jgi:Gnt-I system low-affinity gluconate transporter